MTSTKEGKSRNEEETPPADGEVGPQEDSRRPDLKASQWSDAVKHVSQEDETEEDVGETENIPYFHRV